MRKLLTGFLVIGTFAIPGASALGQEKNDDGDKIARTTPGVLTLFKDKNYDGEDYEISRTRTSVHLEWNIGSIGIHPGDSWQICAERRFKEPCMILSESVPDAAKIGILGGIGSARPASEAK